MTKKLYKRDNIGIPYQGKKGGISHVILNRIAKIIGKGKCRNSRLVDLFTGGGSITYFSKKNDIFAKYHMNDFDKSIIEVHKNLAECIDFCKIVEYDEILKILKKPMHERTAKEKLAGIIYSFSNNQRSVIYEREKFDLSRAVQNHDVDRVNELLGTNIKKGEFSKTGTEIKFFAQISERFELQQLERLQQLGQLERLEQLGQLQQLERLEQLTNTTFSNCSYEDFDILRGDIIYCDPPYFQTINEYKDKKFNSEQFAEWFLNLKQPAFCSEYTDIFDGKAVEVERAKKANTYGGQGSGIATERLFWNRVK